MNCRYISVGAIPRAALFVSRRGRVERPHRYGLPGDADLVNGCADDDRIDEFNGDLRTQPVYLNQDGQQGATLLGSPIALERCTADSRHLKVAEADGQGGVEFF